MSDNVALDRAKELLEYSPETGIFRWKVGLCGRPAGHVAGSKCRGYVRIEIDGVCVRAHRLAWLWVHGCYPSNFIDHINGVRNDNRIANLREATKSQNAANQGVMVTNELGIKGVRWRPKDHLYAATIYVNGKNRHLGSFKTSDEAHQAYCEAAKAAFGEFARFA